MNDTSQSKSLFETVVTDVDAHAIEAFELLSNETRLAILLALWEIYDPASDHNTITFSDLATRINYDSPGNLNYHLEKLVGLYVRKTENGYHITEAGNKVIRAIRAGAITQTVSFGPFEIDDFCPYCNGTVEVSYSDTHIMARCTECIGTFIEGDQPAREPRLNNSRGVITRQEFPPAGVHNRSPEAAIQAHLNRTGYLGFAMLAGTCPECAGKTRISTTLCTDHEMTSQGCESCGRAYRSWTGMMCQHCKFAIGAPSHWLLIRHPTIGAFLKDHGIDVTPGFSMELWSALDQADMQINSADPVKLGINYKLNGDKLSAMVKEDMTVISVGE
ncbi:MAG: winged helix-turn-helix domain-containing protein [Halobacteriaceae archaeon]